MVISGINKVWRVSDAVTVEILSGVVVPVVSLLKCSVVPEVVVGVISCVLSVMYEAVVI